MKIRALESATHLQNSRDEVLQIIPGLRRMKALGQVSSAIPAAVIVASLDPADRLDVAWRKVQVAPAARACQGWVLDMVGATHVSPLGRDRAYVISALDWLETPRPQTPNAISSSAEVRMAGLNSEGTPTESLQSAADDHAPKEVRLGQ